MRTSGRFASASVAVAVVWALCVLAFASDTGLSVYALMLLVWGGMAVLLLWAARLLSYRLARRGSAAQFSPMTLRYALGIPAGVAVLFALSWFGLTFRVRFALSRPALDRFVQEQTRQDADSGGFVPGSSVGLFHAREMEVLPGRIVRLITTPCMFDDCGLAYSPSGKPPRIGEDTYLPLGDGWWLWWRSW